MTNKQLAKQLRDIGNSLFDRTNDPNFKLLLDEASDRLENQSKWINVEERLPEDVFKDRKIITVLVCTKSGRVSTSSRTRMMQVNKEKMTYEYTDIFEWSGQVAKKVTHWMPLPEAPKGGAE